MINKILLTSIVITSLALGSCKKSSTNSEPAAINAPAILLPSITGVDGILVAMNTRTKETSVEILTGTASAAFFKTQSSITKVEAGSVKLNGKDLIKSDDNTYFYSPTAAYPKGIGFGSQIFWISTGNTSTGVPAISDQDGGGFPNLPVLSEYVTLDKTQDKTIDWVASTGGDSVILYVTGPAASFRKMFPNTISKYIMPLAEIAKLGAGGGTIAIINYTKANKIVGGKTYAFVKQAIAFTAKVTIK